MTKWIFPLLVLVLLSCEPGMREGEIIDKEYHPAHTQMVLMPVVMSTGKSSTIILIPMWFYYPDSWEIKIKKFNGKKWKTAVWWVDQKTYNMSTVGGWYKYKDGDLDDQPRIKCKEEGNERRAK